MKGNLLIVAVIMLLAPSANAGICGNYLTPPICIPTDLSKADYPSGYLRHADQRMDYYFENADSSECDFAANFTFTANAWKSICNIKMDVSSTGKCKVIWIDDPNNPSSMAAQTSVTGDDFGRITQVTIRFWEHFAYYSLPYTWCNDCSCPAPAQQQNIVYTCLHEIGVAMGFQHYSSQYTVMNSATGSCYLGLLELDRCCAAFLYQANPLARISYFRPLNQGAGVSIDWRSRYEYETAHYYIEKSSESGAYERLPGLIASTGSSRDPEGSAYEYFDPTGRRGDAYRLIEVDEGGYEHRIGEARAIDGAFSLGASQDPSIADLNSLRKDIITIMQGETGVKQDLLKAPAVGPIQWVAIYPDSFSAAIGNLVIYRNYQGLQAFGITYESVVAQHGNIKAYLQYLWNSQGQSLKYALIVGSKTVIPIDYVDEGIVEDFPANYCTDAITADMDNDWFPEISIGRIPARTAAQVTAYVAKVLDYEAQSQQAWNSHVTFFVNDGNFNDESGAFAGHLATELAAAMSPAQTVHYKSYVGCTDTYQQPCDDLDRRTQAISEFDAGRGVVLGFGSVSSEYELVYWLRTFGGEYEFRGNQLSENYKCAFVIGASCDMGYMMTDGPTTILDELLFAPYRGAIAFFAPSGATWQYANYEIAGEVFNYLYNWGSPSMGYACWRAQDHEMANELLGNAHTARSYIFYGDPAIRLKGSVVGDPPVVIVTDPNGGETYSTPGPIPITWTVQDDDLEGIRCTVLINYSGGSGIWTVLATGVPVDAYGQGSYSYQLGRGTVTYEHCLIQVLATDACNNQGSDTSDGEFTIQLLRLSPKPGDPIPVVPVSPLAIVPKDNYLGAPFPNPFNPITTIGFGLKEPAQIALTIYDVTGAVIKALCKNELLKAGTYTRRWDGTNDRGASVSSGIYFLQMKTESYSETRRLILLR